MSRWGKIFAVVFGSFAVLLMGSGVLLAWTVATHGLVRVGVHERHGGANFDLPVPAALVEAGLAFVPLAHHHGFHCRRDARVRFGNHGERAWHHDDMARLERCGPAVAAFLQGLADAPDAVLVDVQNGRDHVQITKRGRDLEVHVDSPDANVRVSLPVHLLRRVARAVV